MYSYWFTYHYSLGMSSALSAVFWPSLCWVLFFLCVIYIQSLSLTIYNPLTIYNHCHCMRTHLFGMSIIIILYDLCCRSLHQITTILQEFQLIAERLRVREGDSLEVIATLPLTIHTHTHSYLQKNINIPSTTAWECLIRL